MSLLPRHVWPLSPSVINAWISIGWVKQQEWKDISRNADACGKASKDEPKSACRWGYTILPWTKYNIKLLTFTVFPGSMIPVADYSWPLLLLLSEKKKVLIQVALAHAIFTV